MKTPAVKIARTTVLLTAGLLGLAHETFIGQGERPTLIIAFMGMMGLPYFLGKDEKDAEK